MSRVLAIALSANGKPLIAEVMPEPSIVGQKAVGLSKLPNTWVPQWISVPFSICQSAQISRVTWHDIAKLLLSEFEDVHELIVRSSSQSEDLETRGWFSSQRCTNEIDKLSLCLWCVATQTPLDESNVFCSDKPIVCAPIVQTYVPGILVGHLSNEYRHAQRNVDFLYEIEWKKGQGNNSEPSPPRSFRLDRPIQPVSTSHRPAVGSSNAIELDKGMKTIGRWIASNTKRAHVEWLVSQKNLFIVQLDEDSLPVPIKPMSQCDYDSAYPRIIEGLAIFSPLSKEEKYLNLRKTRSHFLLREAKAFVPPIYVADNLDRLDWCLGKIPEILYADLSKLSCVKLIVRFDVSCTHRNWSNLPTIGPSKDVKKIAASLCKAIQQLVDRDIPLSEITLVAHHFIVASASAWSEAKPRAEKIRIDANWGLPDGLQTFAHDTYIWDLKNKKITPDIRYKDRFIDVTCDGTWITRRAYPRLASESCCEKETVQEIAEITARVAEICACPVRIMWFLDVLAGADENYSSFMPWIVVEPEEDERDFWGQPEYWLELAEDRTKLWKKAKLSTAKVVSNSSSLELFNAKPDSFDLGGKHVLFQPEVSFVRDRKFVESFAQIINTNSKQIWTVIYEGSMLSHTPYQLRKLGIKVLPLLEKAREPRRIFSRKLVRDLIPEKISDSGEYADTIELKENEYNQALRQKLIEEALEVAYADENDDLIEELADVMAVMKALTKFIGVPWSKIEEAELEKRRKRGGFEKRLYLQASGYSSKKGKNIVSPDPPIFRKFSNGQIKVTLPIVPPLHPEDASVGHVFSSTGDEIKILYKGHEIEIRFISKAAKTKQQTIKQLSLFENKIDDDFDH